MDLNKKLLIETERLILVPMTFQFASKVLNEDITAYEEFNINPNSEWLSKDIKQALLMLKEDLASQDTPDGFGPWLFIHKLNNYIIGDGGFKGAPNVNGEIDLGYGIIESKRKEGYAFEAANALVKWGLCQKGVKVITADCLKNNIPSYNLLKKLGMIKVSEDDELIYFALNPLK